MFHKRRHQRIKRRFACEFLTEGHRYRGIIVELSRGGLFIQTDATTPPGAEIEIHLAGAGPVPPLRLRGVVVRRRMVPAPLATAVRRGIAVELFEAPREWGLACGSELLEAPILLARDGRRPSGAVAETDPSTSRALPEPGRVPRRREPAQEPERALAPEGAQPEPAPRPEVLLVDDGALDDVEALLRDLAVATRRLRPGAEAAAGAFVWPTRLFVTTARLACTIHLPAAASEGGLVGVAVADEQSQTLSALMHRLGYHYLVHRPAHAEALRLLLRRILYRGVEQRRALRVPFGFEVAWRSGWRRCRGPMVEISASGCRLLSRRGARTGTRIRISIPAEATGDRKIVLRGRIARRELRAQAEAGERFALAVSFDPPSARTQRRLDALLARGSRGPAALPRTGGAAPPLPVAQAPAAAESAARPPCPPAAEAEPGQPPDRRRVRRARLEREILSLHDEETRVLHVLVGRDLSPHGMRIEPHPELALGQRLRLALYEPSIGRPVVLGAEVARDDGESGLALRFADLAPEAVEAIGTIAASLPAVEALRPEVARIVVGELLRARDAA